MQYKTARLASGYGECTCGWKSEHYAHGDDLSSAGVGLVLGFCTGYTIKQVGRSLVLLVGLSFLGAQAASAAGVDVPSPRASLRHLWRRFCDANGLDPRLKARLPVVPAPRCLFLSRLSLTRLVPLQTLRNMDAATLGAHAKRLAQHNAAAACGFVPGLVVGIWRA